MFNDLVNQIQHSLYEFLKTYLHTVDNLFEIVCKYFNYVHDKVKFFENEFTIELDLDNTEVIKIKSAKNVLIDLITPDEHKYTVFISPFLEDVRTFRYNKFCANALMTMCAYLRGIDLEYKEIKFNRIVIKVSKHELLIKLFNKSGYITKLVFSLEIPIYFEKPCLKREEIIQSSYERSEILEHYANVITLLIFLHVNREEMEKLLNIIKKVFNEKIIKTIEKIEQAIGYFEILRKISNNI